MRYDQIETGISEEDEAIREEIQAFLDSTDAQGRKIGDAKCGVYAYFDHDEEPLYVGQTEVGLLNSIWSDLITPRSSLINSDKFNHLEVAYMEVWPLWRLEYKSSEIKIQTLNAVEASVFRHLFRGSKLGALLVARYVLKSDLIELPPSLRRRIGPDDDFLTELDDMDICEECGERYDLADDGWCGLCPDCADRKEAEIEEDDEENEIE